MCLNEADHLGSMFSLFLGSLFSIPISLSLIGSIRGLLPFSGLMFTVFLSRSKSIHVSIWASPILAPVSFRSCRTVDILLLHDAIKMSISCSVGMNGIYFSCW